MKNSPGDNPSMRLSGQARAGRTTDHLTAGKWPAVVGNERLTALAGAVLLVLIVVELVTTANLRALTLVHIVVGILLVGPLVVKMGSTGYRFVRYYTRAPAYVRKGPPRLALRILAPVLLVTTLVVIGSGIGLIITNPIVEGPLFRIHAVSSLIWIPMLAAHVVAYIVQVPRNIADDWRTLATEPAPGRELRLGVNLGALLGGTVAAILLFPAAAPWIIWSATNGNSRPAAPLIAGVAVALFVLLATRLFKR